MVHFIPKRLEIARKSRGMTQKQLVEDSHLPRQSISKYESGKSTPEMTHIISIANVLGYPISFFSKPITEENSSSPFFRKKASVTQSRYEKQSIRIRFVKEIYDDIGNYVYFPDINLPLLNEKDIEYITDEDIMNMAHSIRNRWNLGESPIEYLIPTIESNGIVISNSTIKDEQLDAVSQWIGDVPIILLSDNNESEYCRRFNIAHELGHLVLHSFIPNVLELTTNDYNKMEKQANLFASHFLMPRDCFMDSIRSTELDYLLYFKKYWKVSLQAIIYYIHGLGLMSENQYMYLQKKMSKNGWRKVEPYDKESNREDPELLHKAYNMLIKNNIFTEKSFLNYTSLPEKEVIKMLNIKTKEKRPSLKLLYKSAN